MMTDTTATAPTLVVSRIVAAPRERVFAAFTDATQLSQWFGPETVTTVVDALDLRVGGRYHFTMRNAEGVHPVGGVFEVVEPPSRLAMTWVWEAGNYAGRETRLTILLEDAGNETRVTLSHELLAEDTVRDHHRDGWISTLSALAKYLAD